MRKPDTTALIVVALGAFLIAGCAFDESTIGPSSSDPNVYVQSLTPSSVQIVISGTNDPAVCNWTGPKSGQAP